MAKFNPKKDENKSTDRSEHKVKKGSSKKSRGKRTSKETSDHIPEDDVKRSNRTNDVSWYARSEQSLKDSASLSMANVLGLPSSLNPINLSDPLNTGSLPTVSADDSAIQILPGICTLHYVQSIGGSSKDATTPINVAALNVYSYVRHANSGSANYDATDLMMYILGVSSYFSAISWCIRLYGVMNTYNQRNRYMPKALVEQMNVDFEDMVNHINDLRAFINHKIAEASVLWIPNTMPLTARWFWMNTNLFTDGESAKAQVYMYNPSQFWKFQNKTSSQGSQLGARILGPSSGTARMTFADIVEMMNELSLPLISDEDIGIMAGDILKAYGSDKIYGLGMIDSEYVIAPVYDEEVLMQMHNAIIWPLTGGSISQNNNVDPGYIYQFGLEIPIGATVGGLEHAGLATRHYFDLKGNANDPAIVMVASRLVPAVSIGKGTNSEFVLSVDVCGSEFINKISYCTTPSGAVVSEVGTFFTAVDSNELGIAAVREKFDWAPLRYRVTSTVSGTSLALKFYTLLGEIENYSTLGKHELLNMHRTAMYSLLGVPAI